MSALCTFPFLKRTSLFPSTFLLVCIKLHIIEKETKNAACCIFVSIKGFQPCREEMVHSILVPNQISNDFFSILVGNFNENKNLQLTEQKQENNNSIMFIVNWFWVSWEGRIKGLTKQAEG